MEKEEDEEEKQEGKEGMVVKSRPMDSRVHRFLLLGTPERTKKGQKSSVFD